MVEHLLVWGLTIYGYKKRGDWLLKDGIYTHKSKIIWDLMAFFLLCVISVGWGLIMYLAIKYII